MKYPSFYDYNENDKSFSEPGHTVISKNYRSQNEPIETFEDEPIATFADESITSMIHAITQDVDWSRPLKIFPKLNY